MLATSADTFRPVTQVPPSGFSSNFTSGKHPLFRVMDLVLLGNRALQMAIRRNLVCFPSQAPVFGKLPRRDLQWRLAVLYFIRGWSTREIARRYGLTRERCGQIISDWRVRAVNMGYIQDVTPNGAEEKLIEMFVGEVGIEMTLVR